MSAAFWNGILADHAASQVRVTELVTPDAYRGWVVNFDYGWWNATHPDFEASWEGEEDGWVGSHPTCAGRTREEMQAEVDAWFEEQAA